MPARNIVKVYVKDGYYHVYNRGVEKRNIFLDEGDYRVFLNILKEALLDPVELVKTKKVVSFKGVTFKALMRPPKNFFGKIELLTYALLPNHFHMLLKQCDEKSMHQFIQSICTRYVIYFNKKYKRVGALFQNTYKASLITEEPYLLHLSRYIHRNPLGYIKDLKKAYSSYGEYLGIRYTPWIKPGFILSFFNSGKIPYREHTNSYKQFTEYEYEQEKETSIEWCLDSSVTLEREE